MEDGKIAAIIKKLRQGSNVGGDYRKARIDKALEEAENPKENKNEKVEDVNKHKWKGVM
jgi:hypothetical protein